MYDGEVFGKKVNSLIFQYILKNYATKKGILSFITGHDELKNVL